MNSIIEYFIKYPIAGNLLMFTILVGGIFGLSNMKSTFFPVIPDRNIQVQAIYPGSSPEEIEEGIVLKIEENLKGIEGVDRITSTSQENVGSVIIEVKKGYDADEVIQDIRNAVDAINSFPAGMEPATIFVIEGRSFAINFSLSGPVDLKTLKKEARRVEDELLAKEGISKVVLNGFPEEEIEIAFREDALRKYGMTFAEAALAVRNSNLITTGGKIKGAEEELLIRAENKKYTGDELRGIVVRSTGGSVIRLSDVASISDKWSDNPNRQFTNKKPAVEVIVNFTNAEDILTVTSLVRDYVEEYNKESKLIRANIIRDSSVALNQRINLLTRNGLAGFGIVLFFLALFLNWRLAFWVALAIPVSFAGMFILAPLLGQTINVISLFGMIIVIGILVDDGIVIAENIYQLYEKGMPPEQAAIKGTMDVLPAVTAAIITTMIAFSTFFFLDGTLGDFFSSMAVIVILSLVFSLVEGALILPGHVSHSKALSATTEKHPVSEFLDKCLFWMRDKLYAPVLRFCISNFITCVSVFIIMIAGLYVTMGGISGGLIKGTFFPSIPSENINASIKMPAGTREHITEQRLAQIESAIYRVNKKFSDSLYNNDYELVTKLQKSIGPTTYEGQLFITLVDSERRGQVSEREISDAIRKEMGEIKDAESVSLQNLSPFGKAVSVSLLSADYKELDAAVKEFKRRLGEMEELKDIVDDNQLGLKEVNINLNEKAEFLGLNLNDVISQVRQGFFGVEVQRLQRGRDEVKVWVRYENSDRSNLQKLEDMRVRFANGSEYRLGEIATFEVERGVVRIKHLDGKREVKIEADIVSDQVSVSDITSKVDNEILPELMDKYLTLSVDYGGQKREQMKTVNSIGDVLPMILFLMFLVIAITFRSISQAASVFVLIPFAFIGVAWGHYIMGLPLSLLSSLGIIALIGILVNDALVYVAAYNDLIIQGVSQKQAAFEASISRFRPIVLTSVTTVAGLSPLMYEKSFQAQFLIPMAVAVSFGLVLITVIILLLLPALLVIINQVKWAVAVPFAKLVGNPMPTFESVEPHYQGRRPWIISALMAVLGIVALYFIYTLRFGG